jgi:hypothetical protein
MTNTTDMTNTTMALVLLGAVLLIATAGVARFGLAGALARRRAAWELERVEWRRWITRP